MSEPFLYAWHSVELGCRDYFNKTLGTIEGVTAFSMQNMPRIMPDDGVDYFIWTFDINGGPVNVQRANRTRVINGAWHMNATLKAWCATDYTAKRVGGLIMEALPVLAADVEGLAMLYPTEYPTRAMTVLNLDNENNAGQEQRFFELTVPMMAAFQNTRKIE